MANIDVPDDNYEEISKLLEKRYITRNNSKDRFQDVDQRIGKDPVFHKEADRVLQRAKYYFQWRGILLQKDSRELMIYQSLLNSLKPRTIIELGTYLGGSAVWFADMMKGLGHKCHVYTLEMLEHLIKPPAKIHPGVTCIIGDANNIQTLMPHDMLTQLPHPWLVIEDCHVNTFGSLEHFGKYMVSGDYFAVEDTSYLSEYYYALRMEAGETKEWEWSDVKHKALLKFLKKYKGTFKVDSFYTDLFGFNGTNAWDGYISKM